MQSKPAQAEEKIPALKAIPERLAADVRERLLQRRQELEKEVDRILTMESEQLKTVTHLCVKMKSLVDERVALRKEQAKIHEKATSGQAEEKK